MICTYILDSTDNIPYKCRLFYCNEMLVIPTPQHMTTKLGCILKEGSLKQKVKNSENTVYNSKI